MNKSDLIVTLSRDMGLTQRKSEEIVNVVFNTMSRALVSRDRIEIRGFGSFAVREYRGYTGRNPKTGTSIEVDSKRLPLFKTGKELRANVDDQAI